MFAHVMKSVLKIFLITSLLSAEFSSAYAQGIFSSGKSTTSDADKQEIENSESPRFMMRRFVEILNNENVEEAFNYVEFPKGLNLDAKRKLVEELMEVLNKRGNIDLALISNNPSGSLSDDVKPEMEKIGTILTTPNSFPIMLRFSTEKTRKGWRFSSEFMERIPDVAETLHLSSFENKLPPQLVGHKLFGIKIWQWIGLAIAIAISVLASMLLSWVLFHIMKRLVSRLQLVVPDEIFMSFITPLRLFTGLFVFGFAILFLDTDLGFRQKLGYFESVTLTLTFSIFALRLTAAAIELSRLSYERQGKTNSTAMLGPIRKGLSVLIVVLCAISLMRNLGFDVTAIIAGLGIGGVAIALAGQKTIENLFGGISILMDQPVRVGDFGRFGTTMGTVEDIGLRSTRVRTLDRTVVSIPNAEFSHMTLENFEKRDKFRWLSQLGIRMDASTDQMRLLLMQIKELMLSHPMIYKDPARVRFVSFGASSLNIEIFAYVKASNHNEYIAVVEDMNLRILDIIRNAGTDLAYPAQTLFLERGAGISKEKVADVEKRISQIKEQDGFPQPFYPSSWAEDKYDTLEFPENNPSI
ncbi:MAG: mechanosensitive ion channel family protein [Proteobacteria bacterium]|nr:MAG: mechanosensitive ion channel family protein [Pseudomonadota bacterium]